MAVACLPSAEVQGGEGCWVAGWGITSYEAQVVNNQLHAVGVNIFTQQYCIDNTIYGALLPDDICAGIPDGHLGDALDGQADGGKDSCQGDSGGLNIKHKITYHIKNDNYII